MPHAAVSFTFGKEKRLKSSQRIRDIVAGRKFVSKHPIKCFYSIEKCDGRVSSVQVAMLVSKRKFRHAVDRNRVKRLFREAYRLNVNILDVPPSTDLNMCWMFVGKEIPDYSQVESSAKAIFLSLKDIVNQ